jgi:nitrogen fixation/metabolism regulation signal transduction histidine kinase
MQSLPTDDDRHGQKRGPADLDSVNERLEDAIEQLRLANQALKIASYELETLNNQLEIMHNEVEGLSQEAAQLREGYHRVLDHVPYAVVVADAEGKIEACNAAAQKLFHLAVTAWVGTDLSEFPVQASLGRELRRKHEAVMEGGKTLMLRNQLVHVKRVVHRMDVHFTALGRRRSSHGVLVTFMISASRDEVAPLWKHNAILNSAAS